MLESGDDSDVTPSLTHEWRAGREGTVTDADAPLLTVKDTGAESCQLPLAS
jgi:hypothetical protein